MPEPSRSPRHSGQAGICAEIRWIHATTLGHRGSFCVRGQTGRSQNLHKDAGIDTRRRGSGLQPSVAGTTAEVRLGQYRIVVRGCLSEPGQEIPLAADPLLAIGREPLHSGEDRRRIEVRLGDDVGLEPTGEPLIIPI